MEEKKNVNLCYKYQFGLVNLFLLYFCKFLIDIFDSIEN